MGQSRIRACNSLAALACTSLVASTALAGSISPDPRAAIISAIGTSTNTSALTSRGPVAHTTGLVITKSCPAVANEGETITCVVTIENEDPDHGLNVAKVTNQFPFPCAGLTCPPGAIVPITDCTAMAMETELSS